MEGDEADSLDSWMASAFPAREEDTEARTGQVVGDFRLVRKLGHGGMGQVWVAEQLSLGRRPVAVKFVRSDRVTPRHLELFAREARAGGRLSHQGIVTVLTHGESDGLAWIAMELVPGGRTLRELIDEMARAPEVPASYDREVARLVAEVATAMQVAHDAGIVHRDLKPRNILLTPDGHAKVTDFGMAQITDESALTTVGEIAGGTTHYMSPEQLSGDRTRIDSRSDVFALGVVLYELLALQRPFQGDTHAQIAAQILHKDQPDPRTLRSRIPRDLAVIAGKALEKTPERRYAAMAALAADLRRFLENEPILAKPPTRIDRVGKWIRRNPAKSSAAAVATTTFAVIVVLLAKYLRANSALTDERSSLASANAALHAKSIESEERRLRADQEAAAAIAARDDVLRLSALQRLDDLKVEAERLWPAHPENIDRYERWLQQAEVLISELPAHEKKLSDLRAKARPWTPEEQVEFRASHPGAADVAHIEREIAFFQARMAVLNSGKVASEPTSTEVGLDLLALPADADALNSLAWDMVDPERQTFGDERKGLVIARRALELADQSERSAIRDTLAWALFALARFDEAVAEEERALKEAPEEERKDFEAQLAKLLAAIEAERKPEALEMAHQRLSRLAAELAAIEGKFSIRPDWIFDDDQDKWWHNTLEKLVSELRVFADEHTGLFSEGTSKDLGWGVKKRLANARSLKKGFAPGGLHADAWERALPAIHAAYPGIDLRPQLGLVPIGPDIYSHLWEFAHLETGEPAIRGMDGRLQLTESTGIVFVLLPGGTFIMGSQKDDPIASNYDPWSFNDEGPSRPVVVDPFFLSKYEMTQGQWQRLTGGNPSRITPEGYERGWNAAHMPGNLLHPIETVSWSACVETLRWVRLDLPSEAQWEFAARAGSGDVWCTGQSRESINGAANLGDRFAIENGWENVASWEDFDDGNTTHAIVGSYKPNRFGLHDMIGNIAEWCLDDKLDERAYRGGCFLDDALQARTAYRGFYSASVAHVYLGVRPAKQLQR